MKTTKVGLVGIVLIRLCVWLPNAASARVYLHIGLGSRSIYAHPDFWWSYPYYGWHRGYYDYTRPDRDLYGWYQDPFVFSRTRYYRHRPIYSSGLLVSSERLRLWISNWYPRITHSPLSGIQYVDPIVIDVPKATVKSEPLLKQKYDEKTVEFFIQLRRKKSELLEKLGSKNKQQRKEAVIELAGYSLDTRVREALTEVLLSEPDPELRELAAKSLSKVRNRKALPALEKAKTEDPHEEVRLEADEAIRKISGY